MPSTGAQAGPLVTTPILPPKPTTMFLNSVRALEPLALTLMLPTGLQLDTSDAFLVIRTFSEPGTGATATTQEARPRAKATGTIRVCDMTHLRNQDWRTTRVATRKEPDSDNAGTDAHLYERFFQRRGGKVWKDHVPWSSPSKCNHISLDPSSGEKQRSVKYHRNCRPRENRSPNAYHPDS